jgi:hypothetical protein
LAPVVPGELPSCWLSLLSGVGRGFAVMLGGLHVYVAGFSHTRCFVLWLTGSCDGQFNQFSLSNSSPCAQPVITSDLPPALAISPISAPALYPRRGIKSLLPSSDVHFCTASFLPQGLKPAFVTSINPPNYPLHYIPGHRTTLLHQP